MLKLLVALRPAFWGLLALSVPAGAASPPARMDAAGLEYFEKHIRPALIENCYECHSADAKSPKAGLSLDTREGLLKGGDTGPAIVPGEPERSLLIKAVRQTDGDLKMPPAKAGGKLAPEIIAHLEAWVKMGAPDPRVGGGTAAALKIPSSEHWAFKPVTKPAAPSVKNSRLVQTPVDKFILARLEAQGLSLSPRADKRTLIRRASYTLTGLPPTPGEVQEFEADTSSNAFPKVVDRLLASPRYGERWGRYWLDVARYADTKGYVFEEERKYPYSYTYRDWVIRAFNEDLPYDQFIIQQLAADLLPLGDDKRPLAALGFLTLGRRFLNNQQDIIDDRIDVVCRGTMALTVACARCHDHKFDPISAKDYYGLYGVFASSHEPKELPLLGASAMPKEYPEYLAEREKRETERVQYIATKEEEVRTKFRAQVGDYLLAVHDSGKADNEGLYRERKLQPAAARAFRDASRSWEKNKHPILTPWFAFAKLSATNFPERAKETLAQIADAVNPHVAKQFAASPPASLKDAAETYNKLFAAVDKEWKAALTNSPTPKALADAGREALRQILYGDGTPIMSLGGDTLRNATDTPAQQKFRTLKRKVDELDATHPGAPPRAMAMADNKSPTEPRVFKRGNPGMAGESTRRQFIEIAAGPNRQPFTNGSGRLELAQSIVSRDNPLTARVFVNRAWLHHFGSALVHTPGDFGVRSDPPTHPELLDHLAAQFMEDGWSMKKLHRLMLLSAAWQQSSDDNAKASRLDPANQLLWRQNRQRLDLEAMRDTLLAVSAQIDLTLGGRAVDIIDAATTRRTVYGFVERQNLPGLFRTFDFASPDSTTPQRFNTTVPQQALFLMNSPFVIRQAQRLLDRAEVKSAAKDDARIQRLYHAALQRGPDADEVKLAKQFLAAQAASGAPGEPSPASAWSYGYGNFDEATKRVEHFTPLSHWTGYAWQGGPELPDPKLGWVILNAEGGHVGNDQNHAAIRRWRAPRDGVVQVDGELSHPSDQGDGVRARIVSSRRGPLGEWTARHSRTNTRLNRIEVKREEFIDFITDCRASVSFDSFHWASGIKMISETGKPDPDAAREWSAKAGFAGPAKPAEKRPLSPWEKYAQVLLLSNELMFVD